MRLLTAFVAAAAACAPSPPLSVTSDPDLPCQPGALGCACDIGSSCDEGGVCASGVCVEQEPVRTDSSGDSSASTSTGEPGSSSSSSTSEGSTSGGVEDSTTGSSSGSTTGAPDPVCGDGILEGEEECDDGNLEPEDGCDETCAREKWTHEGVARDVPISDLHLWEPCWVDTYEAGDTIEKLQTLCQGDHLLVACRPAGADVLTVAAHAPREVVFTEVNYNDGYQRTLYKGVDWYWSPYHEGVFGFGPWFNAYCYGQGDAANGLCWKIGGNMPLAFVGGWQCGSTILTAFSKQTMWERVVFQAWE